MEMHLNRGNTQRDSLVLTTDWQLHEQRKRYRQSYTAEHKHNRLLICEEEGSAFCFGQSFWLRSLRDARSEHKRIQGIR
jgi:hypothetical protein